MAQKPVPLQQELHKNKKIKQTGSLEHIEGSHLAPAFMYEFPGAALDYPILFVKDPSKDEFRSILMWGLEPGENLLVNDGKWEGGFVPSALNVHPFTAHVQDEKVFIGLFEDSELVNEDEGQAIFGEDGKESEWFNGVLDYIRKVLEHEQLTVAFCKEMEKLELFAPQALTYKVDGEEKKIDGFFVIDQQKFSELSDEQFLELRKKGMLDAIYAHLTSLSNINKLLKRKLDRTEPAAA